MTPGEYRALQNRINRTTAVQALAMLRAANPATDRDWTTVALLLHRLVYAQRGLSRDLALAYYASLAPTGSAPNIAALPYTAEMTTKALDRFRARWGDEASSQLALSTDVAAAMVRHGEQGGRDVIVHAAHRDEIRFARIDPMPPCCSWCTLFISRGPVYLTNLPDSGGFMAHDHDTCVPVPVHDENSDWPGRAQYEAAEAFYVEHAAGAGPGQQIGALRAAVAKHGSPV